MVLLMLILIIVVGIFGSAMLVPFNLPIVDHGSSSYRGMGGLCYKKEE